MRSVLEQGNCFEEATHIARLQGFTVIYIKTDGLGRVLRKTISAVFVTITTLMHRQLSQGI